MGGEIGAGPPDRRPARTPVMASNFSGPKARDTTKDSFTIFSHSSEAVLFSKDIGIYLPAAS